MIYLIRFIMAPENWSQFQLMEI